MATVSEAKKAARDLMKMIEEAVDNDYELTIERNVVNCCEAKKTAKGFMKIIESIDEAK